MREGLFQAVLELIGTCKKCEEDGLKAARGCPCYVQRKLDECMADAFKDMAGTSDDRTMRVLNACRR